MTIVVQATVSAFYVLETMITDYTAAQPPILMNRFLINLRSIDTDPSASANSDPAHFSRFTDPNFRVPPSFLGNIGESLQYGRSIPDNDVEANEEDVAEIERQDTEVEQEQCVGIGTLSMSASSGITRDAAVQNGEAV